MERMARRMGLTILTIITSTFTAAYMPAVFLHIYLLPHALVLNQLINMSLLYKSKVNSYSCKLIPLVLYLFKSISILFTMSEALNAFVDEQRNESTSQSPQPPVITSRALEYLQSHNICYSIHQYQYVEGGGSSASSSALGVDEHYVLKTLVFTVSLRLI